MKKPDNYPILQKAIRKVSLHRRCEVSIMASAIAAVNGGSSIADTLASLRKHRPEWFRK